MDANELYARLDEDFIKPGFRDGWADFMDPVSDFLCEGFKETSMGLVCDNSLNIRKIYSAVFPTDEVMRHILGQNSTDALLFVHHPMVYDIRRAPEVFRQMSRQLLRQFKERKISIYCLHFPLDDFGAYSTSNTLANALGVKVESPFAAFSGALCGVFGKTSCSTVSELQEVFAGTVGHDVSLYQYGDSKITENRVAIAAGGGNMLEVLHDIAEEGINTFITGITVKNQMTEEVHAFEAEHRINLLGGTHYSTEKFACMEMCRYFGKLNLACEFVEGWPILEDL